MQLPTILSATLGLSKSWSVTNVVLSKDLRRLDITVDFVQDETCVCPFCGIRATPADIEICTWFQKDFLDYETYLHARTPRGVCIKTNAKLVPPWNKKGSKFTQVTSA